MIAGLSSGLGVGISDQVCFSVMRSTRQLMPLRAAECMRLLHQLRIAAHQEKLDILAYALVPPQLFVLTNAAQSNLFGELLQRRYQGLLPNEEWSLTHQILVSNSEDLYQIAREIEARPSREGLSLRPEDYRWSSAAAHTGQRIDLTARPHPIWENCHGEIWASRLHAQLRIECWEFMDQLDSPQKARSY